MTEIGVYDRSAGRYKPFRLTPRRKQILWHIAYGWEVRPVMRPNFAYGGRAFSEKVLQFFLGSTNIHQIVMLLRQAKLVHFKVYAPGGELHITPLGMHVLLESLP